MGTFLNHVKSFDPISREATEFVQQLCIFLPNSCKTLLKLLQIQSNINDISLDCLLKTKRKSFHCNDTLNETS